MSTNRIMVEVQSREERGKNACRRLRARGRVPGTVYGMQRDPVAISVPPRPIEELLRLESGRNTIFTLSTGESGQSREVMIRDLQRDPVSDLLLHVDFLRVDLSKLMTVRVPVHLTGLPLGVKNDGGILDFVHREITVECLPTGIPEHLDVDVSALLINQHVSVADLHAGEGVRIVDEPQTIIAVVTPPRAEELPTPAAGEAAAAAPAEPEVIKKGKEAGEEKEKPGDAKSKE
ncbi:MAG TPA: 50S ribosomal protein L25 [Candidatus Polarisedimenticolaceae bacterium]|nr:50S ribosomal protein L25 [Candidatus Polarisedimenticolaceae bacterium]